MRGLALVASAVMLLAGAPACRQKQPERPDARPPTGALGLKAGAPPLVESVRAVVELCQVSSKTGRVNRCPADEDDQLRRREHSVGTQAALSTYCHGLGEADERVRALSARGLSRLAYHRSVARARDPRLLSCMLGLLDGLDDRRIARPLARASAFLATALRQEAALLPLLRRSRLIAVKEAGYGALWASGRLRVFDTLSRLIGDAATPLSVRVAAVNGFTVGGALRPAEQAKVCGLVGPLLAADPLPLASAAARCAAETCPALGESVLKRAETLRSKGRLDPDYICAVRTVDSASHRASPQQRARILTLFTGVVEDPRFSSPTRAAALSKVSWIDRSLALKLARAQLEHAGGALRQTAAGLLE